MFNRLLCASRKSGIDTRFRKFTHRENEVTNLLLTKPISVFSLHNVNLMRQSHHTIPNPHSLRYLSTMVRRSGVRNVAIVAHVDHGS
mmetsp:Transcript_35830/g.40856  ORF Transcript_35830/g.40856 Transcript_35830/m.40856 type:complete len:87 (-) Transcript_35830:8-268(-)